MRQGIIGFVIGVLVVAAVFAFAGKTPGSPAESRKFDVVVLPGVSSNDSYIKSKAYIYNVETGKIDHQESAYLNQ